MSSFGIELNRQNEMSLRRQIYQALRDQILSGKIKEDEVLPSTRELAENLEVSRNTVTEAYDMLITEGYIYSRQGAPTRVAAGLSIACVPVSAPIGSEKCKLSILADFHTGRPDLRCFPRFLWQQLQHKASVEMTLDQYGYTGPQGLPELRSEIAKWLYRSRGLKVNPEEVFITAGATHALHLAAELLCKPGLEIIMEDPCHIGMRQTFVNKGCSITPIPVDEYGMQTQYLTYNSNACAVYVTPSHQFPLGGILPAARRTALVNYARENDIYIIEDDYDSEFRYCGEPIAPLHTLDPQRVIYVGTFSKILFPALRIGYVLLPRKLQKRWKQLRTFNDVQNPSFEQAVLAKLMASRKLDRHILMMRHIYGERRLALIEALSKEFGSSLQVYGDAAGLHLAVEFSDMIFDDTFKKASLQKGIYITPLEHHCIIKGSHQNKLLLGYGHLALDEIRNAVRMLSEFLKNNK